MPDNRQRPTLGGDSTILTPWFFLLPHFTSSESDQVVPDDYRHSRKREIGQVKSKILGVDRDLNLRNQAFYSGVR